MDAPSIFPTFRYRDADAAIAWFTDTIGFSSHFMQRAEDGTVSHAELALGSSIIMVGQSRDDSYDAMVGSDEARRTDAIYIAVAEIDPLYERVRASTATIVMELYDTGYGSREFTCRDAEGNLWSFGTYWPKVEG